MSCFTKEELEVLDSPTASPFVRVFVFPLNRVLMKCYWIDYGFDCEENIGLFLITFTDASALILFPRCQDHIVHLGSFLSFDTFS